MKKFLVFTALLAVVAVLGVGCALEAPSSHPPLTNPTGNGGEEEGSNFQLLVSDEPNDIGDFANLFVTISEIGVLQGGEESGEWLQFTPDIGEVDLKLLIGENAQSVWSGNITAGEYSKVFVYVSEVRGVLAGDNGTAEVKLPSDKLQISKPFTISENSTTSFVFDITVVKTGQGKYILKPQIAESGAGQKFQEVNKPQKAGKPDGQRKAENQLTLKLEGEAAAGENVTLIVSFGDGPVAGATVTVNDASAGTTDADGKLVIVLPDSGEVEIKATEGDRSGKLEIDLNAEAVSLNVGKEKGKGKP